MASSQVGKKEIDRVLGPNQRYYLISDVRGEIIGETTDVDIYSYHRTIGKTEQQALKRVDHVMTKQGKRALTRPRK